jgi:hypothetical protein
LHSYKANKRDVLDQLGATLALAQKKATLSDEAFQKLELLQSDMKQLNEYAAQIFETVMPLGKSIYQVNGILAHLESYEYVGFQIDNVGNIDSKQFNRLIWLLKQFTTTIGKMTDDYKENPWYGATVASVSHELRYDINQKLGLLIPKVSDARQKVSDLYNFLSLDWCTTYQGILDIIPVIKVASEASVVPTSWILGNEIEPLFGEVSECETLKALFCQKQGELSKQYDIITANDAKLRCPILISF